MTYRIRPFNNVSLLVAKKQKFYVVWEGKTPGIYDNWGDCQLQINGFEGAKYKSFESIEEARSAFEGNPYKYIGQKKKPSGNIADVGKPIWQSISVDAACSGNPGVLEYRGVETATKRVLFKQGPFPHGTVNIGEFLALVHGLAFLQKHKSNLPIYSDSRTAMAWVRKKKANTKMEPSAKNKALLEMMHRAEDWLKNNKYSNPILKWETKAWGEIPADYDRK